ncbi:MAG: ABC-F family ATP-binding cassette domain-containing protein [Acidobacteria bacterium]|nr:ABC-F family ATP-binding cassette domain-containing protein [Acidobacteriota bacterium]
MAILIDLQKITLDGADRVVLDTLDLTVSTGDRIGVVGINGTGKSALLKILAGSLEPHSGNIRRGRGVHVGFLEQIPRLPAGTVRHALGTGWQVDAALDRLGMLEAADTDTAHLSGGQQKRVALARIFAETNDVLILDEPTNHLDLNAIQWLEQQIIAFRGAVILVSHDRFLLDQVTTRMVEIDRGKTYLHAGGYSRLLEAQAQREEQAATAEQTRRNLARIELAWLRRGVKARSTKPQARIDAAQRLLATRPEAAARSGTLDLSIEMPRLGTTVIKAHNVNFTYPNGRDVLRNVNLELGPGDRIGIVGPNGAGKSTFINLLAQRIDATSGTVKHGPTVVTSYFEQDGGDYDLDATVQELVAGPRGIPGSPADVALMKRFWFTGALPLTKAKDLSGGERRRLQLLLALSLRPNVLFLDEPTNDLDLETIRLIEDFLSQWPGTLVVVSHDRTFLSRTTERLLEVHPDGTLADIPGGIDAWIARAAGIVPDTAGDTIDTAQSLKPSVPLGRQIRDTEKEIARLERRRNAINEKILATLDHREQTQLGEELTEVRRALSAAEDLWFSLSE